VAKWSSPTALVVINVFWCVGFELDVAAKIKEWEITEVKRLTNKGRRWRRAGFDRGWLVILRDFWCIQTSKDGEK
jgi:hypothetical protein